MTEPCIAYEPWESLDRGKRYCLADTMVLLEIYRRNPRLAAMAEAVRGGRTLLLVPGVVDECVAVFHEHKPDISSAESIFVGGESGDVYELFFGPVAHEDFRVEPRSREEFDCLLAETLQWWNIEFATVRPEPGTLGAARKMHAEKTYRNKKGAPLSPVDCSLLRLAMENPNVNVLTDDAALAKAVLAECGQGRASRVLADYFGRLNMTARFLSAALGAGFIDCKPARNYVEYRAAGRRPGETSAPPRKPGRRGAPDREPPALVAVRFSRGGAGASYGQAVRDLERSGMRHPEDQSIPDHEEAAIRKLERGVPSSDAVDALTSFFKLVVLDWYCACGDPGWAKFDKEWTDMEYDLDTMQVVSKTHRPYYDTARDILKENLQRYCACARPDERRLHEAFKAIVSKDDEDLEERLRAGARRA